LRWMNRSDHWQNLAWLGELLHTPGSTLTLTRVYHSPLSKNTDFCSPLSHYENLPSVKYFKMNGIPPRISAVIA